MGLARARFAIGAIITLATACGAPSTDTDPGASPPASGQDLPAGATVLAKVGPGGVTAEEFARAAATMPPADGRAHTPEERRAILDALITEEVLYQEAVRKGLHRDPKIRRILVNLLMREDVYSQVDAADIDEAELRSYFEAHRAEFVIPERLQLWRIFIKVGDQRTEAEAMALANDLRARLDGNAEASFADLALEFSEDPYQRRGGDIGFITAEGRPGIDPLVVSTAFQLPDRVVSQPFLAGGGVNLVYVPQRRERIERGFEQMKGAVSRKLKNERYEQLTETYVQKARARYPVEIDEGTLDHLTVPAAPTPTPIPSSDDAHGAALNPGHEDHLH